MTGSTERRFRGTSDLVLVGRQVYYEQLNFWLNPVAALFTIGFSLVFLILLASSTGNSHSSTLGGLRVVQYYVPGFIAYGLMATCFSMLTTSLVVRREMGLLKRIRLSPLPTSAMLTAVLANAVIISLVQVVLLLLIGRYGYQVAFPHNAGALIVALVVGAASFTAIGVAMSTLIPNQDAAGPVVSIIFFVLLFLSGLWYPIDPHSGLAKFAAWFPIRHLIEAIYAPFDTRRGVSGWAWHDILVMAIWGVVAGLVAVRCWSWAPHRSGGGGGWRRRLVGGGRATPG
jgi:ABC-2 type transport system permease protein